jgi:creatinine amidohydrolase
MQTPADHVFYAQLTPAEFRARLTAAPVAYLPLGTLEWHGPHLPLGADGLQSQGFFAHLAERVGGIILPMLFLGPDGRQEVDGQEFFGMDIWGFRGRKPEQLTGSAYWIENMQFTALLERILANLKRAGFKIVVAHGHGPSTGLFGDHIPEWSQRFGLKLFTCWREQEDNETDGLGLQKDHAAANETSLTMALHPDLVHMEYLPQDPQEWPKAILGQDPRLYASPEVGRQIMEKQGERMESLLHAALASLVKEAVPGGR